MIRLAEVVKEYSAPPWRAAGGRVRALDGVSLEVAPGTALGIVGPNGAGKSTLIRLLLGYLRPTSGEVRVGGLHPREYAERHGVGYVPESVSIPPRWTVRGALGAFAALGEVPDAGDRIDRTLEMLGLEGLEGRRVGALSKGNLQKLALAQALLGPRRLLLLDEPLNGLDPVWVARLRDVLAAWRAEDPERVLLLVSHNLPEVERAVDRVAVLAGGRIRAEMELRAAAGERAWRLELASAADGAVAEAFPGAARSEGGAWTVRARDEAELSRRLAALLGSGARVRALEPAGAGLEERLHRVLAGEEGAP
ncbi:MAG TPA: ABC transporter ATP-binding protein [Longimicrobiaceae bacterium]|nr:ABC transporter ATP-binding protein [Longimicrobiaceae bacterium]